MSNVRETLQDAIERAWPGRIQCRVAGAATEVDCQRALLTELCTRVFHEWGFAFASLIVEETDDAWQLRYVFYGERDARWLHVLVEAPLTEPVFPSIAVGSRVFGADWHEREAEDFFGIEFAGHPRLGDFVLHDDVWQEDVQPMRKRFDATAAMRDRAPNADWRPRRVVRESGAFLLPVGPKFSGISEAVHFQLETVGEDVIRSWTRLFYKWRAIEKLAEGKSVDDALLIAERFAATTAFAHGMAFCQAVESITATEVPARACTLRVLLAELERLRHHAGAIEAICESTGLAVASSQAALLEEDLLRVCGALTGHRYLFGMLAPGGLLTDLTTEVCRIALQGTTAVVARLDELEKQLSITSSFLDRIEQVGIIAPETAVAYSLVGPVARGSAMARDLRDLHPYGAYQAFQFRVPCEDEGDGYARLRVLFAEARQSLSLMEQAVDALRSGDVRRPLRPAAGAGLGWVEAPRGATFHWVRLDQAGRVARYRVATPSFANWHSFHLGAERFAFQDFPIILSTFDLSAAENDR
jgi:formate hydrogenlyase subunit 5